MNNDIEIVERETEQVLEIHARVPMWKMPFVMSKAYKRIAEYFETAGVEPSGVPYAHYLNVDWADVNEESKFAAFIKMFTRKWEFLSGFPVGSTMEGSGDIQPGTLPGGRYIQTLHRGPYHKVGGTYKQLMAWVAQEGLTVRNASVEIYLNDPRTTKQADLETIVLVPLSE